LTPGAGAGAEVTDYGRYYLPVAENLRAGNGLVGLFGEPSVYPPGYPLILAALLALSRVTGLPLAALIVSLNTLLAAASSVFVAFAAAALAGRRAGFIAGLLWASYPLHLRLTAQPHVEVPFLALVAAGVAAAVALKPRVVSSLAAGAAFAVATVVRPVGVGLAFVAGAFALARPDLSPGRRRLYAAIVVAPTVAVMAAWAVFGTTSGAGVLPFREAATLSITQGFSHYASAAAAGATPPIPEDVRALARDFARACGRTAPLGTVASFLRRELPLRPAAFAKLALLKLARAWYGTMAYRREGAVIAVQIFYLALAAVGARALVFRRSERGLRRRWAFLAATVAYFYVGTVAVLAIIRYMMPAMMFLMVFAGKAGDMLISQIRRHPPGGRV
jgi:hypothetical protein